MVTIIVLNSGERAPKPRCAKATRACDGRSGVVDSGVRKVPVSGDVRRRIPGEATFASRRRFLALNAVLVALTIALVLAGFSIGAESIPLDTVWKVVLSRLGVGADGLSALEQQIVWELRVPRVMLGLVVGAGLAIAGTVIQAIVRNPLGDPYLIGIVPGATLGAVAVIAGGTAITMHLSLSAAAFVGGLLAFVITFLLSRQGGQWPATRLVLSGVAIGYLFSSMTFFLQVLASPSQVQRVLFWTLGSVAGAHWENVLIPGATVALIGAWLLTQGDKLNALSLGTEVAGTLGINIGRLQFLLMAGVALITGTLVAVAGGVGFVGLVIPHIARLLVGAENHRVLVTSTILGGAFLVGVDILARSAIPSAELPLGIFTAAIGAPFLIWLLQTQGRTKGSR